jgi:predicted nuclease with TOPRIM domain
MSVSPFVSVGASNVAESGASHVADVPVYELSREMVESLKAKLQAERRNRKLAILKKKLASAKKSRDATEGHLKRLMPKISKLEERLKGNEALVLETSLNTTQKLKELNRMRRVHDLHDMRRKRRVYEEKMEDASMKMTDLIAEIEKDSTAVNDASTVNESDDGSVDLSEDDVEFVSESMGDQAHEDVVVKQETAPVAGSASGLEDVTVL